MTGLLQHQEQLCAVVDYVHGQDLGGSLNCLVECFEVGRRLLVDADDNIALSEALRDADLTIFSGRDIAIVDSVIHHFWDKTAAELSELSHGPWWKVCDSGDGIPYGFSHLSDDPIISSDVERTKQLSREYGWAIN